MKCPTCGAESFREGVCHYGRYGDPHPVLVGFVYDGYSEGAMWDIYGHALFTRFKKKPDAPPTTFIINYFRRGWLPIICQMGDPTLIKDTGIHVYPTPEAAYAAWRLGATFLINSELREKETA